MTRPKTLLWLVAIMLLVASMAVAQTNIPIDDFEILPFSTSQTGVGTVTDNLPVPPPATGHVISTTRHVTCTVFAGGGTASAELTTSGLENAAALGVPANAQVTFTYPLSPSGVDLTVGGTVDRIEMDVRRIGGGAAEVFCALSDLSGGHLDDKSVPNSPSYSVLTWSLTAFGSVDLEDITEIQFGFPDAAAYDVREIRLRGASSTDISYELYEEATMTPPLPTPPVEIGVFDPSVNPLFDLDLAITQADAGFTPSLQWGWTSVSALSGQALHGVLDWTDFAPFDATQLAFTVEVSGGAGGFFPELYPPDPIHGPEGVSLVFPVRVSDAPGGNVLGTSEVWLTIDPGSEQAQTAMEFVDVMVGTPTARGGSWTDEIEVSFLLLPGAAGVETIWPILETRMWMDWSEAAVVAVGDPVPLDGAMASLTAAPSVMRTDTRIRLPRALEREGALRIHDIQGRRVATLRAPAGATGVRWDGRDDFGRTLPAGVYLVRLEGARGNAARIVMVR